MIPDISGISVGQLRDAIAIKEQIEGLQRELQGIFNGGSVGNGAARRGRPPGGRRRMSAEARARIAAAQRARWAKVRGTAPKLQSGKKRRTMSAAARARIAAAQRARWAKVRAGK